MPQSTPFNLALLLNRLTLGYLFAHAGCTKIFVTGVHQFVHGQYALSTPPWLPHWFATPYGYALPFAELILGSLLILGLLGRWPAGLITLMLLSIMFATLSAESFKNGQLPAPFFYLAIALLLLAAGPGKFSLSYGFHKSPRPKSKP